jgi:hypothetical protein
MQSLNHSTAALDNLRIKYDDEINKIESEYFVHNDLRNTYYLKSLPNAAELKIEADSLLASDVSFSIDDLERLKGVFGNKPSQSKQQGINDLYLAKALIHNIQSTEKSETEKRALYLKLVILSKELDRRLNQKEFRSSNELIEQMIRYILNLNPSTPTTHIAIDLTAAETFNECQNLMFGKIIYRACSQGSKIGEKLVFMNEHGEVKEKLYKTIMNQIGDLKKLLSIKD